MFFSLRYDMRAAFETPVPVVYRTAIEQVEWADRLNFFSVYIGEHHGAEDNYIPSPIVLASAMAARTTQIRLHLSALLLPLHNPIHVAEDLAVLDNISNGRLDVTLGLGYRPHEFDMFGISHANRARIYEESLDLLLRAWTGSEISPYGVPMRVLPRPTQNRRPRIFVGGSAEVSAHRAAVRGLGYRPAMQNLYALYEAEMAELGFPAPEPLPVQGPNLLYVSEDPDKAWAEVGPYFLHTTNSYATWAMERKGGATVNVLTESLEALKASPHVKVLTPGECVDFARNLGPNGELLFQPMASGMPPELSWASLELFAAKVLPQLAG
jgi:alkanesulfonate monooxygenase SsuD/methylene tetrahydromethanopterin reductase-like flavin-dependent oxidoreductase (luciferase family)